MSTDTYPPFAQKIISKLRRYEECTSDSQGADIGREWFDVLTQLGLLARVQRSPALWEMTQQGEDLLESLSAKPRPESLVFEFMHPGSQERRTVSLTKNEIGSGMEDVLYERLVAQFCSCESVGETNVVDCNCDEYGHDFELIANTERTAVF